MTTKVMTVRFPRSDFEDLQQYAELEQLSLPELVRKSCVSFIQNNQHEQQFKELKKDILQSVFLMLSIITDLSDLDRQEAARLVNKEISGVSVR